MTTFEPAGLLSLHTMATSLTNEAVLKSLSRVQEPDLKRDLVTLKMIEDLNVSASGIQFTILLTTPACPLKDQMEADCKAVLKADFGAIPVTIGMRARTLAQKTGRDLLPGVKNVVLVASGKGGVGKSTVSANLAVALAQTGAKVGLMDADIYGPSVPMMFGLQGQRPEMEGDKIIPILKHGVKVLSIGLLIDEKQAIVWRGPMASNALRQFFTDVSWGELDYLLIDLPPGTGDIHLTLAQLLEVGGAVLVTTPQQVALADARKAAAMFNMTSINIPMLGVIENMSWFTPLAHADERYYIFGKGGGRALADEFGVELLGQIPLVQGIAEAADQGQPVVLHEGNPSAHYYAQLAGSLAQQLSVRNAALAL